MTEQAPELVKILFRFYSRVLEEWVVETMWASVIDKGKGFYKIDNIPFYASIAPEDVVFAEYDNDECMLTYREIVSYSDNSIVQVVMMDRSSAVNEIRTIFTLLGCKSEKLNEGYFVMEILAAQDYQLVRQKLLELEAAGILAYAEPVLSERHDYR